MTRFAVVSHVLPPSPSGQAVALFRILANVPGEEYCLIQSGEAPAPDPLGADSRFRLPGRLYSLPPEPKLKWPQRFKLRAVGDVITMVRSIRARRKKILAVLRGEPGIQAVIACTGDMYNIPSAFLASRKAGIPFYAYIFDDYVYQWTGHYRWLAKRIAPLIFKRCQGIVGANEFTCTEYQRRYKVNAALVRNPHAGDGATAPRHPRWPAEKDEIKILYTGAVYHINYDCFRNLIQAMESLADYHLTLDIFTDQPCRRLEAMGIKGKQVRIHPHAANDRILEKQQLADILFLPLSFAPEHHEVLRTAAPGKMGEYLASGRPVLAHVPADSFIAYYFAKNRCGWVAGQNDATALAKELEKIISAPELRAEITSHARRQAALDFSPDSARTKLLAFLHVERS